MPRRRRSRTAVFIVIAVGMFFAMLELASRMVVNSPLSRWLTGLSVYDQGQYQKVLRDADSLIELDLYSGYRMRESRDPASRRPPHLPLPPKRAGELRVLCMGDSTTHGINLPEDKAWPGRLQVYLDRWAPAGVRFEVYNGGSIGYSPLQCKRLLQSRLIRTEPDLILWMEGAVINDYLPLPQALSEQRIRLVRLMNRSAFIYLLGTALRMVRQKENPTYVLFNLPSSDRRDTPENVLPELVRWTRVQGVSLFLGVDNLIYDNSLVGDARLVGIAADWEAVGVPYVSCLEQFREQAPDLNELFIDRVHFREAGADLMARIVSQDLQNRWPDIVSASSGRTAAQ